jgi:membrane-associated protease RseP (regulator of RpoE activity)
VLLRLTRMRGVDLDVFDFDYDLTWMAFFLGGDGRVLGRYGGRDAASAEGRVSLAGLRHALAAALEAHRRGGAPPPRPTKAPRTAEQFPAASRLPRTACVRCHEVYDLRRRSLQMSGRWALDELWVYPPPENVGLTLEVDRGDYVARVAPRSAAARLGLTKGDRLLALDGRPVASYGDVQYALHKAPPQGKVEVRWRHGDEERTGQLALAAGWRKSDVSWRWSLRGVEPSPWVQGDDLDADEKKELGLAPKRLAFRQGPFVSAPARQAGVRQNDVIVGIDGKELEMTERQFALYVRLNYKVGDRVTYNVLRRGRRLDVPLRLAPRAP